MNVRTLRGRFCLMTLPCVIGPGDTGAAFKRLTIGLIIGQLH